MGLNSDTRALDEQFIDYAVSRGYGRSEAEHQLCSVQNGNRGTYTAGLRLLMIEYLV